jgi:DNA-binding transcriptional ArsR family regulator
MNRILWWLIAGSKGGANRASILIALKEMPCNAHQLSERLALDYKTIQHHLRILDENRLIVAQGGGYGKVYFLSKELDANYHEFLEIWERVGKKEIVPEKGDRM